MFNNPFSFKGRIRRLEWGITIIILIVAYSIAYAEMIWAADHYDNTIGIFFAVIAQIPISVLIFSQGARRCHDLGNSGWWQLIPLYMFIIIFIEGQPQRNKYGENPKSDTHSSSPIMSKDGLGLR